MEKDNKILDELKQLCPALAGVENKVPYTTSANYFSDLPGFLLEKITLPEALTNNHSNHNLYTVPHRYFDNLAANIITRVQVHSEENEVYEEMELLSPLLNTIDKQQSPYTIPKNYFDTLDVKKSTETVEKGKIAYFRIHKNLLSYATAAVVTGILAVGIFFFVGKPSRDSNSAVVSSGASYNVKTLSEQEIVNFLKTTSPQEHIVTNTKSGIRASNEDSEIKQMISEMSDKEIKQFLMEDGEDVDM